MSDLEPYDLRDPRRLIHQIGDRVPLEEDTAWLALVRHPSTEQELVRVDALPVPALLDDDDDISDHLRRAAEAYGIGWSGKGPEHMAVTVIVRPGFTVFGPNEAVWFKGWRYANHLQSIYTGELILVTEHGWADFMSHSAGNEPRMVRAAAVVEHARD
jgi:hypothetical protein